MKALAQRTRESRLPGDAAMWIFIVAELVTFAAFFLLFACLERSDGPSFAVGRAQLHPPMGLLNTLLLLTGGVLALAGVRELEAFPRGGRARLYFKLAAATGLPFTVIKVWEFGLLMGQGLHLSSSTFHFLYFFLCFIHLAHVWLGMAILLIACRRLSRDPDQEGLLSGWQAAASYWHMVDLVWLVLFPLCYLGGDLA